MSPSLPSPETTPPRSQRLLVALMGLLAGLYLINPGAGVLEIIPDNFPVLGNLDEATAAAILLAALRYYGLDLTGWWRPKKR
ncbi:MAG: DUF1232 domain-containing protein [Candidatus Sericytochromatia bacterium]|nr:DUF1232 domain-containing protein [Candidatus Sericytochromatia bacterium]